MLVAGTACAALVAAVLGLLLARYREIFFAMLSLAFSMILYGLLVKSSTLGSGRVQLHAKSFAGIALGAADARRVFYGVSAIAVLAVGWALHRYLGSQGRLSSAIRDNELRVEYLGASVYRVVYVNYVVAAALAGLGGAFAALAVGHVDPETVYWTTSASSCSSPSWPARAMCSRRFLRGDLRGAAHPGQYAPNIWQMALGAAMLAIIMFLPGGLWTLLWKKAGVSALLSAERLNKRFGAVTAASDITSNSRATASSA